VRLLRLLLASCLGAPLAAHAQSTPLRNDRFVLTLPGHWLPRAGHDGVLVGDQGQVVSVETSVLKGEWPAPMREEIVRDEAAQAQAELERLPADLHATLEAPARVRRLAAGGTAYSVAVRRSDGSYFDLFFVLRHPVSVRISVEGGAKAAQAVAHAAVDQAIDSMVWSAATIIDPP